MRSIVFRYSNSSSFALALREGDQELALPPGEQVLDGEWVLAVFEVGTRGRATAAAARGLYGAAGAEQMLAFEQRDWERLIDFADAGSTTRLKVARAVPRETPTQRSLPDPPSDPRPDSRPTPARSSVGRQRASAPVTATPAAPARVLLVDDDRDIREVVGAMLDAVGLAVEASTSAEEALERVRSSSFDLVVLDWNLPGMTGIELCRLIRRDPMLRALPVLFLTAHASSRDVVDAFASGADDYVVKPFRAPELGARIFGLLRRARMGSSAS